LNVATVVLITVSSSRYAGIVFTKNEFLADVVPLAACTHVSNSTLDTGVLQTLVVLYCIV